MRRLPLVLLLSFAAVALAPTHALGGATCSFRASGLTLAFGNIDPSSGATVTQNMIAPGFGNMAGDCNGSGTMTISITDGASSRQLKDSATPQNSIAYSISGFPVTSLAKPGNNSPVGSANGWTTWFTSGQITGQILWTAYGGAPAGTYTETVSITVNP